MKRVLLICCLFVLTIGTVLAQGSHPVPSDPAEKAKGLQKQLKLTDDQTKKITVIYQESARKFDKIKADEHGNTNKMLEAVKPLRVATIKKIKALLTAEQVAKYDALVKESKNSSLNGGWSDGWSSASA